MQRFVFPIDELVRDQRNDQHFFAGDTSDIQAGV